MLVLGFCAAVFKGQLCVVIAIIEFAGMTHELLAPTGSQPGIVVHICDDGSNKSQSKPKFMHTKCPEARDE